MPPADLDKWQMLLDLNRETLAELGRSVRAAETLAAIVRENTLAVQGLQTRVEGFGQTIHAQYSGFGAIVEEAKGKHADAERAQGLAGEALEALTGRMRSLENALVEERKAEREARAKVWTLALKSIAAVVSTAILVIGAAFGVHVNANP